MGVNMIDCPSSKPLIKASDNFDLPFDIEVLMSLAYFILLTNVIHYLIKLSQACDIFICNVMQIVKLSLDELAHMFLDASIAFNKMDFPCYNNLISFFNKDIPLQWRLLLGDSGICHLVFNF